MGQTQPSAYVKRRCFGTNDARFIGPEVLVSTRTVVQGDAIVSRAHAELTSEVALLSK